MNKFQILSFTFTAISIFYLLNLKFEIQRYINVTPEQAVSALMKSKPEQSEKRSLSMLSSKMFYIASAVIGVVAFLLLSISLVIINGWFVKYNLAESSSSWLPIEAVISEKGRQGSTNRSNMSSTSMYYSDNVYYTFLYKGKKHKGQRLSYDNGWATSNPDNKSELLNSVPNVGEKTTIYFDEKTGKSVMFPGRSYTNYWALILTTPLYLLGVFISFYAFAAAIIGFAIKQ